MFNLGGSIPSELGALESIKMLFLRGNALTGRMPSTLGLLTELREFELNVSSLSGPIPSEFGYLTQLSNPWLDHNPSLRGTIPSEFGTLSELTTLNLKQNHRMSVTLPTEIGMMIDLMNIHLEGSPLTGTIPSKLGHNIYISTTCPLHPVGALCLGTNAATFLLCGLTYSGSTRRLSL